MEEWVPAVAAGESPKWPDPERKGPPGGLALHSSCIHDQAAGSGSPEQYLLYTKEKEGKAVNAGLAPRTKAAKKVETAAHPASGL